MSGRRLLKILSELTDEQLDNYDLSVQIDDEFYPVSRFYITTDKDSEEADGILDEGSPVIVL